MRIGLDLREVTADECVAASVEADRLGLWAVLIENATTTVATLAAELAAKTQHIHLAMCLDADRVHPLTLAEEVSLVDHLSQRRVFPVLHGTEAHIAVVQRLLLGHTVETMTLAPPPAQSMLRVHQLGPDLPLANLSGDLTEDRQTIDHYRKAGTTHLFVTWPDSLLRLARHLASRAATPDFPQIVADHADIIAPQDGK